MAPLLWNPTIEHILHKIAEVTINICDLEIQDQVSIVQEDFNSIELPKPKPKQVKRSKKEKML